MLRSGQSNVMQVAEQYADRKMELEAKIRSLESEKSFLVSDIATLKERVTELELEKQASSLQGEVDALRTEKAVLEEKAATYDAGASFAVPTSAAAGL
jgi:peptidoglycan hydrolase CwlO-like protein